MSDPLPIKYRPRYFDEMMGNEKIIKSAQSILKKEKSKIPHAWLFTGPSGTGKTTFARILKDELGCEDFDFQEYNAGNTRGIDTIRQIQEDITLYPRAGDVKIYFLDEAHKLTPDAQEAILKLLEDPPPHGYIFLATTNPEKLIRTIHSRCTTIKLSPLNSKQMKEFIDWTLFEEIGEEAKDFPKDVIQALWKSSNGACRDALKLLDMIIEMEDFDDMIDVIEQGVPQEGDLKELCNLLKTPRTQWKDMAKFLRGFKEDPETIRLSILTWFSKMLLDDGLKRTAMIIEVFGENNYYYTDKSGLILSCYAVVTAANK